MKRLYCYVHLVLVLPICMAGFLVHAVADAFMSGWDIFRAVSRVMLDQKPTPKGGM